MLVKFLISLLVVFVYIFIKSKRAFQVLQQNWYDDDYRYFKWIIENRTKVFVQHDMYFVIFITFLFMGSNLSFILFSIFYIIIIFMYRKRMENNYSKKPLVFTKRIKRLLITVFMLYLIPVIGFIINFDESLIAYYYLLIGLLVYLEYFVVMVANKINIPIEKMVFNYYKNKATDKLKAMKNLKVIGITGSYGKTSSKNILNDILNVKFNSFATPKSYNTMNGLMLSINNYLDKFSDVFIAEMGAFVQGEILEKCEFIKPKYGILTKIGTAHLESFKTQENIQSAKFELIDSLPDDGIAILNMDDELQTSYEIKSKCKCVWIGIENKDADFVASKIKLSNTGTSFTLNVKGDLKSYKFETKLLGHANIYNILAGIALGYEFGLSMEELILGVKRVNTIEHRLELKKYSDINIIDDAYNSNPVGAKMALDVLGMMDGKKIIVTPGMIELGDKQYEYNMEFGKQIAEVCDEVILIGKEQTKPIYDGLLLNKFKEKNIYVLNDVKEAFVLMQRLKKGETFVLLENDLPDIFSE